MKRNYYLFFIIILSLFFINVNAKEVDLVADIYNEGNSYVPSKIKNGGFENYPELGTSSNTGGSDWQTTEMFTQKTAGINGYYQIIDLNYNNGSSKLSFGIDYSNGKFIELNSINHTVLYQNIDTKPNEIYFWKLNHAPRNRSNNGNVVQKMVVYIGNNGDKLPDKSNPNIDNATIFSFDRVDGKDGFASSSDLDALSVREDSNWRGNEKIWKTAKGVYLVPNGQNRTRFALTTVDSNSSGNLVDDVFFETLIGNISIDVSEDSNSFLLKGYYSNQFSSENRVINYSIVGDDDVIIQNGKIDMANLKDKTDFSVKFSSLELTSGTYKMKISNQGYNDAVIVSEFNLEKQTVSSIDVNQSIRKDKFVSEFILIGSILSIIVVLIISIILLIRYKKYDE